MTSMELEPEIVFSKWKCGGKTVYFCSKRCEEEFKKNPERYARSKNRKGE